MEPAPVPWRRMCRKPFSFFMAARASGGSAPRAGVALMSGVNLPRGFQGIVLAVRSLHSQRWNPLAAPRSAAAVLTLVAAAIRRHQHAALGAGWRAFVQIAQFRR